MVIEKNIVQVFDSFFKIVIVRSHPSRYNIYTQYNKGKNSHVVNMLRAKDTVTKGKNASICFAFFGQVFYFKIVPNKKILTWCVDFFTFAYKNSYHISWIWSSSMTVVLIIWKKKFDGFQMRFDVLVLKF